jgi:hypothetical protein
MSRDNNSLATKEKVEDFHRSESTSENLNKRSQYGVRILLGEESEKFHKIPRRQRRIAL